MKRVFAVLIAAALVIAFFVTVSAKMVIKYDDWLFEKISDDALEIDEYIGTASEVTLINSFGGLPVTAVGDNAFVGNNSLEIVHTDSTLTSIGDYGFSDCQNLSEVNLTHSLTEIGVGAFVNSFSLTSINLEATSITSVPAYSFSYSGISEIALPFGCLTIGNCAFQHCMALEKISIPDTVTSISDNAFVESENVVIYANSESCAIEYAIEKGIPYVITNPVEPTVLPSEPDPTEPQPTEPDSTEPDPHSIVYVIGDSDGDGEISILDATKIQRLLAELDDDPDGMIAMRGDSNGDGIDILDATRIQRYLAEYYVAEPIGETVAASLD